MYSVESLHIYDWRSGGRWFDPGSPQGVKIIVHIYDTYTEILRSTSDGKQLDSTYLPRPPDPSL